MKWSLLVLVSLVLLVGAIPLAQAQSIYTWDGGGGADTSWGNALNWVDDVLPAFDGTESILITSVSSGNTALELGADRSISRITFGAGTTSISLNGHTLTLTWTGSSAGSPHSAIWNANTNDGVPATVNSNIRLQSGAAGSYTAHFRENNNSNGGTWFNGAITEGAGESWTLRFSRASARGLFVLNNASNSFSGYYNEGAAVYSGVPGAFAAPTLTMGGGTTGTRGVEHYNTPVTNNLSVAGASIWESRVPTRLTGMLSQGSSALTYGTSASGGILTRLEYSSVTGSGATTLNGTDLSVSSMAQFASGTLNIGGGGGRGILILSGASGHDVPTWDDFIAARTFAAGGGANTWRINVPPTTASSVPTGGGFAARGADLVIPHQSAPNAGGLTNTTFTNFFALGSTAMLDGVRYANHAVKIETDIDYGSQAAGTRRPFNVAHNTEVTTSSTNWVLGGPVHELSGRITGENIIIYPFGTSFSQAGIVRISNPENSLTGESVWVLGGSRSTFTTLGGRTVTNLGNQGDLSSIVMIFTSDGAFGGAAEVEVGSRPSDVRGPPGMLLFEGDTTFTRNFNVVALSVANGAAAWGSYAGNVVYKGTVTYGGNQTHAPIHVQGGTLTLDGATFINNRTVATSYNKGGPGELIIRDLTMGGTQSTNNWAVYQGKLTVNTTLPPGHVTVYNNASLGGTGVIQGNVSAGSGGMVLEPGSSPGTLDITGNLTLNSASKVRIGLGGFSPGDGSGFHDQVNVAGNLTLANAELEVYRYGSFDPYGGVFYILSAGGTLSGTFLNLPEGATVTIAPYWTAQITYQANWTGDPATSTLTGGNDIVLYNVIPEPGTAWTVLLGAVVLTVRRRMNRV